MTYDTTAIYVEQIPSREESSVNLYGHLASMGQIIFSSVGLAPPFIIPGTLPTVLTELLDYGSQLTFQDLDPNGFSINPITSLFSQLVQQWKEETRFQSGSQMLMHPAYQRIIGMGGVAVPLILNEMVNSPGHWFWALFCITGIDAAKGETNVESATNKWLEWGVRNGLI